MDSTGQQIQSSDTSPDARYIGVDIAKAHLDAWDSARPGAKRFPQDEAGLEAFVCWLSEESAPIENLPENLPGRVPGRSSALVSAAYPMLTKRYAKL